MKCSAIATEIATGIQKLNSAAVSGFGSELPVYKGFPSPGFYTIDPLLRLANIFAVKR